MLRDCMQHVRRQQKADDRFVDGSRGTRFSSRVGLTSPFIPPMCLTLTPAESGAPNLPGKVKFFGWLLHHQRLNTRAILYEKNICALDESYCEFCNGTLKTDDHIISSCPRALAIWAWGSWSPSGTIPPCSCWVAHCLSQMKRELMCFSYFCGTFGKHGMQKSLICRTSLRAKSFVALRETSQTGTAGSRNMLILLRSGGTLSPHVCKVSFSLFSPHLPSCIPSLVCQVVL